jgi:hypothetical protein
MESSGEDRPRWRRRRGLVGPVLLIALGVVFLLNNTGALEWDIWWTLFSIWPVLLIAAGIDLLIGYRSALGSIVALVLIVAVVAGALFLAAGAQDRPAAGGERISYSLDGAEEAEVRLSLSVARLRLSGLSDSSYLVDGDIAIGGGESIERSFSVDDGVAELELSSEQTTPVPFAFPGLRAWDLGLNSDVSVALDIDLGVGQVELDLAGMMLTDLAFDAGVGQVTLTLPEAAASNVRLSMGVGLVTIDVPEGVEVRIRFDTGLVVRSLPDNFQRRGDYYYTPGYQTAECKVDLDLDLGVGIVTVSQQ